RDVHLRAVLRENDVARPVAAAFEPAAAGNTGDDRLARAARPRVAAPVREAHDRSRVRHVNVLRVRADRIEGDAEWLIQALGEEFADFGPAIAVRVAQHADAVRPRFRDEEIALRRGADHARVREIVRKLLDAEARRHLWHRAL